MTFGGVTVKTQGRHDNGCPVLKNNEIAGSGAKNDVHGRFREWFDPAGEFARAGSAATAFVNGPHVKRRLNPVCLLKSFHMMPVPVASPANRQDPRMEVDESFRRIHWELPCKKARIRTTR